MCIFTFKFITCVFRLGKRKASFDPNVDEDATETDLVATYKFSGHGNKPSENGCLMPSDSDDEDLPNISFSSSQGTE